MSTTRKRGRPWKVRPVFADPDFERLRVERCLSEGRDPYPPFKHVPCEAERELRKGIMPGVPFDLALLLNDSDDDGRPICLPVAEKGWAEAKAKRTQSAQSGGEQRQRGNLAVEIITADADYIRQRRAAGAKKADVINGLKARRRAAGQKCAGRSEMYKQLGASGLWD